MGQLGQESDIQDLCAIRKPAVWHRGDSGSNDGSDISVDDQRPATNSDHLQSQHSRSGPNVHEPVDGGGSGDVTHPTWRLQYRLCTVPLSIYIVNIYWFISNDSRCRITVYTITLSDPLCDLVPYRQETGNQVTSLQAKRKKNCTPNKNRASDLLWATHNICSIVIAAAQETCEQLHAFSITWHEGPKSSFVRSRRQRGNKSER